MTSVYEDHLCTWLQKFLQANPTHPRLVDLWSVGVILYEAVFGRAPFSSQSLDELISKIKEDTPIVIPRERKLSNECRNFLSSCLQRNPDQRLNFEEVREHPFLNLEDSIPTETTESRMMDSEGRGEGAEQNGFKERVIESYKHALKLATTLYYYGQDDEERRKWKKYIQKYRSKINEHTECNITTKIINDSAQQFTELRALSKGTQGLADGLEIISSARDYLLEGDIQQAVDKYTAGLSVLMPLLQKEPKGRRRDLLHACITSSLDQAETLKNSLLAESEAMQKSESSLPGEKDKASCSLQ